MTTWGQLVSNRVPVPRIFDSAMYIECMKKVRETYPDAEVVKVGDNWQLISGSDILSKTYKSHPECWLEVYGTRK